MSGNLDLWNKLGKTDPKHTKGFKRAGGFGGTAIKPIYTEQKMTEHFGPCGVGWGINEPTYQVVPASEGQIAVYCTTSIWIHHEGKVSAPIFGVGGDLVVVKQSGGLRTDDEAFKKAFTDAVGNAMKHLGMSADVHMGLFDDSKYVDERRQEEAGAKAPPASFNAADFEGRLSAAQNINAVEELRNVLKNLDEATLPEPGFTQLWNKVDARAAAIAKPSKVPAKASLDALEQHIGQPQ